MKAADLLALPLSARLEMIERAAKAYPKAVTGHFSGCKHPAALLRYVLECRDKVPQGAADRARDQATNFISILHGGAWNAMCDTMSANAWLVWYGGQSAYEQLTICQRFPEELTAEIERLGALGWNRDEIAAPTGYTDRQLRSWANGEGQCKPALATGVLSTLKALEGPPPRQPNSLGETGRD